MNKRSYYIPPRATPNPRQPEPAPQHEDAANYMRAQIAHIYDDTSTRQYPEPVQASQSADPPASYSHTYKDDTAPYDWQTYHAAWQNYYSQYYQRYFLQQLQQRQQQLSSSTTPISDEVPSANELQTPAKSQQIKELRTRLRHKVEERAKKTTSSPHFKPIVTALIVGSLFLLLQFNRTLVAQAKYYISPGTLTNDGSSIIINPDALASVGPEPKIIIPKINVDVPVVYDELSYDETKIQKALERGVVHYGNSAVPGVTGNNVIVGHSSNDLFDPGGYKFAFVLIDRLNNGDIFMLNYQGKRYVYKVTNKAVISPTDFSLINITPDKPMVTLITCTPPGTALKRLIVQAEQISPEPNKDQVATKPTETATLPSSIPGNSPTFLERIKNIFN